MNKKAKPTRAQLERQGNAPVSHKCPACGYAALSKYALKEHKGNCNG